MTELRDPPRLANGDDPATRALREALGTLSRDLPSPATTAGVLRGVRAALRGTEGAGALAAGAKGVALKWLGLAALGVGMIYGVTRFAGRAPPSAVQRTAPGGHAVQSDARFEDEPGARGPSVAALSAAEPALVSGASPWPNAPLVAPAVTSVVSPDARPVVAHVEARARGGAASAHALPAPPRSSPRGGEGTPAGAVRSDTVGTGRVRAGTSRVAPRGEAAEAAPRRDPRPEAARAGDELALLRAAQAELVRDPTRALVLLARHAQRFRSGSYAEERDVLALDALTALGRVAERRAAARAFLRSYPRSMHAARVLPMAEAR